MCPACGEPMAILGFGRIEVDRCPRCRGVWLDAGELEAITRLAGAEPGRLTRALAGAGEARAVARRCPRCRRRLLAFEVGERGRVEIDRCPRGHGLWFDAGELEAVVHEFSEGQAGAVASFFSELFREELASGSKGD